MTKTGCINAKIDQRIHTQMKNYCLVNGMVIRKFIEQAITEHLKKVGKCVEPKEPK